MEKNVSLSEIRKKYKKLESKYKLPSFSDLNEEFEIEKVQERETEFLLREIRRAMSDKVIAFLRFLELFLNPVTAPLFVLVALKNMSIQDKEKMESLYQELVRVEIKSIILDIEYSEAEEAKFIKEIYAKWKEVKKELGEICKEIEKVHEKSSEKKSKSYFG
ncbi:MAG: hypothetical protein QXP53_00815 [Candidatus Pacearchaeota archaeon]